MTALCEALDPLEDWRETAIIVVAAAIATDTSVWSSDRFGGADIRTFVGQQVGDRLRAFAESAEIFETEDDRRRAQDLVQTIGGKLLPDNPLGWAGQGLLVLLETNCPNNTLPVFWKEGRYAGQPWTPLFRRAT